MKTPISIQSDRFLVDADSELICETRAGTPEELAHIVKCVNAFPPNPSAEIPREVYRFLQATDLISDGYMAKVLNDHGLCNWTVCPLCKVDDFVHVEGCELGGQL